jgi:hypothetical protein
MGQPPILDGKILLIIKDDLSTKSWLDIFFCAVSREAASSEIEGDISLPTLLFFGLTFRVATGFCGGLSGSNSGLNSPWHSQTATDKLASFPVFFLASKFLTYATPVFS